MTTTYNQLEEDIFNLLNQVRQNPHGFLPKLEEMRKLYDGKYFINADLKAKMATHEGVVAVDEAIESMKKMPKFHPLKRNRVLDLAARQMQDHLEKTGKVSAQIPEMKMAERVKTYIKEGGIYAENISFGAINPGNVLNQFLISDGIKQRIHRINLMNPKFTHVGVSLGPHSQYGYVCVLQFYGPSQGKLTTLIDLYHDAYDPKVMPKVADATSVKINIQSQVVDKVRNIQFTYTFKLKNGGESTHEVKRTDPL